MFLAIGSDHAGYALKEEIKVFLSRQHEMSDVGTFSEESCDYPDYAEKVCQLVLSGKCERGILICGTGIGMSIRANRFNGIRAALCHDTFTANRAREHNDANVIALGSQVVDPALAKELVTIFLKTGFDSADKKNERHFRRIVKLDTPVKTSTL